MGTYLCEYFSGFMTHIFASMPSILSHVSPAISFTILFSLAFSREDLNLDIHLF